MAQAGIASRRKSEELIKAGLVRVNGKIAKLGNIASEEDNITVDGKKIKLEQKVYILLNKPKEVISSVGDYRGRVSVTDLVKVKEKVFPVGRLDYDTEGLMILTNDGDLANKIMHPSYETEKGYEATLDKRISSEDTARLHKGILIDGVKVFARDIFSKENKVSLKIHEGRKHIVKRLFWSLGYEVMALKRTSIGRIILDMPSGKYQKVSREWIESRI